MNADPIHSLASLPPAADLLLRVTALLALGWILHFALRRSNRRSRGVRLIAEWMTDGELSALSERKTPEIEGKSTAAGSCQVQQFEAHEAVT